MARHTHQKRLLQHAIDGTTGFFTVDDIHDEVKEAGVSLATTYRFLNKQAEQGVLYPYVCDGRHVYSRDKRSHCHYVCERTGKKRHFDLQDLGFLEGMVPGSVESVQLEVRGTCTECGGEH